MVAVYMLLSIFSQLSLDGINRDTLKVTAISAVAAPVSATHKSTKSCDLAVKLDKLNGIRPGSPVVASGKLIGTVESIVSPEQEGRRADCRYEVSIDLTDGSHPALREGTVALVSSPMTPKDSTPDVVVELMVPERGSILPVGARIQGFSSFEHFWSASAGATAL